MGGYVCCGVCVPGVMRAWGCLPRMPPPPVNRMTDTCEKVTMPQTSFAGGKYDGSVDLCVDEWILEFTYPLYDYH